jgi:hypothetical protein
VSERLGESRSVGHRFPVLIEICDQAFSIGTSCVLLTAGHREKRAVRDFRAELLWKKVFRANDDGRIATESAKKTGGRRADANGTH